MKNILCVFIFLPFVSLGQWDIPTKSTDTTITKTAINAASKGVLVFKKVNNHIVLELTDVNITAKTKNVHYEFVFWVGSTTAKTIGTVTPDKQKIILEKAFETKSYIYNFRVCEKLIITINGNEKYVFDMSNIYTAYQFVTK